MTINDRLKMVSAIENCLGTAKPTEKLSQEELKLTLRISSKDFGNIYDCEYFGGRLYVSPSGEWYELQECRDVMTVIFYHPKASGECEQTITWVVEDGDELTPEDVYRFIIDWENKVSRLEEAVHNALHYREILPNEKPERVIARYLATCHEI